MLRYAITDRSQLGGTETVRRSALLACAARWAREGIDFVQVREKDLPAAQLLCLTRELQAALHANGSATKLLLNSRVDLALAAGIDGVHLPAGQEALTPAQARLLFAQVLAQPLAQAARPGRREPTISVSCHTLDEVQAAAAGGADLILFGPVFGKCIPVPSGHSAPERRLVTPAVGLEDLRAACALAGSTTVLALGGITRANTSFCLKAGAAGIAAIRLFQQAEA
jgi:thiamine-phosphate pyrophosphorylase